MKKIWFLTVIFTCLYLVNTAVICSATVGRNNADAVKPQKQQQLNLVWQPIVDEQNDLSQLPKLPGVNIVSPSWFVIDGEDGHITDNSDYLYGLYAKRKGYKIWALITNDFSPEKTHKWLRDKQAKKYIINQMIFYAKRYPIDGYNFDFENIYDTDKDALSAFVEEAAGALHRAGLTVSMDITVQSNTANWSGCYDRQRLGKVVDYIVLMAYDEHGRLSKTAGSVASLPWVENGIKNLTLSVPPQKIILGVPLYMRLWETSASGAVKAATLDMTAAEKLLQTKKLKPVWLAKQGQYYFTYQENGKKYEVWQEEAKSLALKAALVKKYNLAGTAAWRKGFETQDIWNVITAK